MPDLHPYTVAILEEFLTSAPMIDQDEPNPVHLEKINFVLLAALGSEIVAIHIIQHTHACAAKVQRAVEDYAMTIAVEQGRRDLVEILQERRAYVDAEDRRRGHTEEVVMRPISSPPKHFNN